MKKVNQTTYKKQVIKALKKARKPIWLSDLHRKYGLAYCTVHGTKENPASQAIRSMINLGQIIELRPRYYKVRDNQRQRIKISLPNKNNPRSYFELELIERIEELEKKLNQPWYKRIFK